MSEVNNSASLNDRFNHEEFLDICRRFGARPNLEEIVIRYKGGDYFCKIKDVVKNDRRGEVAFCVLRPNGKAIVIACEDYPEGIFRIPTGGIGHEEDVVDAVYREVKEELGLDASIITFAGVLKIRFEFEDESVMFYSYLFILRETGGRLLIDASDAEISSAREVSLDELESIVERLKNIPGRWHDWGRFRYETSRAILKHLRDAQCQKAYKGTI